MGTEVSTDLGKNTFKIYLNTNTKYFFEMLINTFYAFKYISKYFKKLVFTCNKPTMTFC